MYRLDHLNGPQKGQHRCIYRRRIEAGSDLACQIWAGDGLAPRHAEFVDDGAVVRVRALSPRPLRVNGREVREAELQEGDRIELGPLVLRFSRRRFHGRDLLRWLPLFLVVITLIAAGVFWGQRWRAERRAYARRPLPSWVPPQDRPSDPTLEALEAVAERVRVDEEKVELERLRQEMETQSMPPLPTPTLPEEPPVVSSAPAMIPPAPIRTADPTAKRPAPPPTPPQKTPRLRIREADLRRFPATSEYEDLRLLRIVIAEEHAPYRGALAEARVLVTFYDAPAGGGAAEPTRTRPQPVAFDLRSAAQDGDGQWILTTVYTVPRGFRDREHTQSGRRYAYHGFVVQVWRDNRLEDALARPPALAESRPRAVR